MLTRSYLGPQGEVNKKSAQAHSVREDAMKHAFMLLALVFALVVVDIDLTTAKANQQEKKTDTKETKWQGYVRQILKDQSIMNIRASGTPNATSTLKIAWDDSTLWTKQNKPGQQSEVKEGSFIIAVGQVDDKGVLHATRIDLRLPR